MPHVNTKTYPRAVKEYELEYVEVVSDFCQYLPAYIWVRAKKICVSPKRLQGKRLASSLTFLCFFEFSLRSNWQ